MPNHRWSEGWPHHDRVREWQTTIRNALRDGQMSQAYAARICHVALNTFESWLMPADKPSHRTPTFVAAVGIKWLLLSRSGTLKKRRAKREAKNG